MSEHQKQKKVSTSLKIKLLAVFLLIVYLIVQVVNALMNIPITITAIRVTADNSFSATGWFFRNEVLADGVSSETVKHIVRNGEKVQQDAALAIVYTDAAALEASQKISVLNDEIELLDSAMETSTNSSDAAKMDQQIVTQISSLSSQVQGGIVSGVESEAANLRNLCLRRSAGDLNSTTLSAQLSTLTTERDGLEKQIVGRSTTISSPADGYFSEIVDGFEGRLTTEALETFTLDDLNSLNESEITDESSGKLGKVISSFRWYFALAAPITDLEGIEKGTNLRLRFPQVDEDVAVTVHDIRQPDGSSEALLILSGMGVTPELVTMRCQSAEVIRSSYTGIRVPKTAVKIGTDKQGNPKQGVYILTGSMSRFKQIDVLYEGSDYYIVRQGTGKEKDRENLVAGDNIIVKGRGLDDRKVIR